MPGEFITDSWWAGDGTTVISSPRMMSRPRAEACEPGWMGILCGHGNRQPSARDRSQSMKFCLREISPQQNPWLLFPSQAFQTLRVFS